MNSLQTSPPNPLALLQQLEEARRGGNTPARLPPNAEVRHGLVFNLADLHLVVPVMRGLQIVPLGAVQPLPLSREWVKGMMYSNGEIYTLIDFAHFIGRTPSPLDNRKDVLLCANQLHKNALLLEGPIRLRSFAPDASKPRAAAAEHLPEPLKPFVRTQWVDGQVACGVLELKALLSAQNLVNIHS